MPYEHCRLCCELLLLRVLGTSPHSPQPAPRVSPTTIADRHPVEFACSRFSAARMTQNKRPSRLNEQLRDRLEGESTACHCPSIFISTRAYRNWGCTCGFYGDELPGFTYIPKHPNTRGLK
ncbi:hypothetical protein BJ741DRAFT_592917 [Chytriomyces cf. hyalinus JEL632]|nr:hypothetical protein BJ741DRAFT_592917 [Chytriomyces cf. hyalinus JEL632]